MQVLNIFHVLIAIAMVAFILIQKGAGATAGAAFGSGASGTVFGSRGAGNFLSRTTWIMAALFCAISLTMAVMASRNSMSPETDLGVVSSAPATEQNSEQVLSDLISDLPVANEAADSSDLPSQNAIAEDPAIDETAGDLPAVDDGSGAQPEEDDDSSSGGGV